MLREGLNYLVLDGLGEEEKRRLLLGEKPDGNRGFPGTPYTWNWTAFLFHLFCFGPVFLHDYLNGFFVESTFDLRIGSLESKAAELKEHI